MSNTSPRLSLPYMMPSQAQKHVTHNDALQQLDALVQLGIATFDATQPPASPGIGEIHAVGPGAEGDWLGQDGQLAFFTENGWRFIPPQEGWRAWSILDAELRVYSGGIWISVMPPLQNIDGLGIGTASDQTNRLAIASDASLFSHAGSDHRLKINKAAEADTASLLFQSGWSGRAEMGLTGDEDFRIRVSDDGSVFHDAMQVRRADGVVHVPCLMSGKVSIAKDNTASIPTPGAGGIVLVSMVDVSYPQTPHAGMFSYDTGPSLSLLTLAKGASLEDFGATPLTGTTCTDGRSAIAVGLGEIILENRHGGIREYAYTFLNTF
ncbi:MAG: DUF2793 domain-containing protein [Roseovarius sp.]